MGRGRSIQPTKWCVRSSEIINNPLLPLPAVSPSRKYGALTLPAVLLWLINLECSSTQVGSDNFTLLVQFAYSLLEEFASAGMQLDTLILKKIE